MKTQLPSNVTLRVGDFVLSLTQEDKNDQRLNVALIRDGKFIPTRFWLPGYDAPGSDSDVASYVDAETLATIIANASRLSEFASYAQD
jgi:hypothetical protein